MSEPSAVIYSFLVTLRYCQLIFLGEGLASTYNHADGRWPMIVLKRPRSWSAVQHGARHRGVGTLPAEVLSLKPLGPLY